MKNKDQFKPLFTPKTPLVIEAAKMAGQPIKIVTIGEVIEANGFDATLKLIRDVRKNNLIFVDEIDYEKI